MTFRLDRAARRALARPDALRISFVREGEPREEPPGKELSETNFEPVRSAARAAPAVLRLDTTLVLSDRDVALITYDPETGRLMARATGVNRPS